MLKQDILDAVDFEVSLTKLVLKRTWAHKHTTTLIHTGKSSATVSGVIKLTDKHLLADDYTTLQNDIRHQIAHLVTGITHKHDFSWQYIANKLQVQSSLIRLNVKEVEECKYCNTFTVLAVSKMCHQCKTIHDAILLDENIALKILHDIGEHNEY